MPVIKSAKKKLRQDKKRVLANAKFEQTVKDAIKDALKQKNAKTVSLAQSLIGKAAKKNIYHKNKAARLTSRLNAAVFGKKTQKETSMPVKAKTKTATKKAPSKKTK